MVAECNSWTQAISMKLAANANNCIPESHNNDFSFYNALERKTENWVYNGWTENKFYATNLLNALYVLLWMM